MSDSIECGPMPVEAKTSRRLFLAAGSAAAVFATVKTAIADATPGHSEAQLLTLEAEIARLNHAARTIVEQRVDPFEDEFFRLGRAGRYDEACALSQSSGREDAVTESNVVFAQADHLFDQLMAIPASTQASRVAKVRSLLVHVKPEWRGSEIDDWADEQVRNLLAEFAGMTAEEIANV
jgi:hypothetical protein